MKTTLTACAALTVASLFLVACGDEANDQPSSGGSGGSAGTAGNAGTAGAAGFSGSAGSAGSAGAAGAAGSVNPPDLAMARSSMAHNDNPNVSPTEYAAFLSETNAFGLDLFHAFSENENTFLSPTSTVVALAMTYAGARGDTATQMAAAMHSSLPPSAFHAAVNQMTMDLAGRNIALHDTEEGQKSLQLSLINGAFAQDGHSFLGEYLDILSVNYDAGIYLLDFAHDPSGSRDSINQWVAYYTEDRIPELLGEDAIQPTTRLVLTNALYFYGSWSQAFNKDDTADATFHTYAGTDVTVPTMNGELLLSHGAGDGYQIVDLPYDGEKVRMTVVLPDAGRFDEIRNGMTSAWLDTARGSMVPGTAVDLALPKFSFTWGTQSFTDTLKAMGMVDAFTDGLADFSGMDGTQELFIQDVLHQAFVGVDEDGTEAAAATAVIVGFNSAPDSIEVSVDRPFVFFITDDTGAMLFAGQVTDPSGGTS